MNNQIFREFAEKVMPETHPLAREVVEGMARETFSPAYELLEEALKLLQKSTASYPTQHRSLEKRITALLAGKENESLMTMNEFLVDAKEGPPLHDATHNPLQPNGGIRET